MIFATLLASAAVPADLAPLDFLAGHCWRGTLPNGGIDTHCFDTTAASLRDHHVVQVGGKTIYSGDTIYAWDPKTMAIRFTYVDVTGGLMRGIVKRAPSGLDFGDASYIAPDGTSVAMQVSWARDGDRAYSADSRSPGAPAGKSTRYVRID